ncbi:hypothetical protein ABZ070_07080 [Streptomyces sp. NPDC006283]|uniref:hypothetical protein n=1 Tax=Streptomyces sp. NPDC006283 TaxID=3156741 RepID=UPI0033B69ED6
MSSLVGKIILIVGVFAAILFFFGSGIGEIELGIWGAGLIASLVVTVRLHRKKSATR